MKKVDFYAGLGLSIFSLVGIVYSKLTFKASMVGLSAGAFPTFLLLILLICSLSIFFLSFKKSGEEKVFFNFKKIIPISVLLVLYALLFRYVGFVISTILFLFGSMLVYKEKRREVLILVSLITSFSIYFLFKFVFRIPL